MKETTSKNLQSLFKKKLKDDQWLANSQMLHQAAAAAAGSEVTAASETTAVAAPSVVDVASRGVSSREADVAMAVDVFQAGVAREPRAPEKAKRVMTEERKEAAAKRKKGQLEAALAAVKSGLPLERTGIEELTGVYQTAYLRCMQETTTGLSIGRDNTQRRTSLNSWFDANADKAQFLYRQS